MEKVECSVSLESYPILLTDGRLVFATVFKAPWSKFGDGDGVVKEGTVGWISGNQICTFVLHEKEFAKVHGIDQGIQPNDEQSSGPPLRAQRQGGAKKAKASESGGGAKKAKASKTGDKGGIEEAKKAEQTREELEESLNLLGLNVDDIRKTYGVWLLNFLCDPFDLFACVLTSFLW